VDGDAALLERIAGNLIENGVRYNRPGGFVDVRTRADVRTVELRVENSGPRVESADAARLAEPFERLAREADAKGAGLGLSIVRAVSHAHGGTLAIEPRTEGGLVVYVRLPRAAAGPDGLATDSRPARRAPA
jgi:signal transduction histidine kinase